MTTGEKAAQDKWRQRKIDFEARKSPAPTEYLPGTLFLRVEDRGLDRPFKLLKTPYTGTSISTWGVGGCSGCFFFRLGTFHL